jgi:hypothetical protein
MNPRVRIHELEPDDGAFQLHRFFIVKLGGE